MDLTKPTKEELDLPSLKKLHKMLPQDQRKLLSYAMGELEIAIYNETRRELLVGLKKELDKRGKDALVENLLYRLSKPELIAKKR